jgi:hypothetical protein
MVKKNIDLIQRRDRPQGEVSCKILLAAARIVFQGCYDRQYGVRKVGKILFP